MTSVINPTVSGVSSKNGSEGDNTTPAIQFNKEEQAFHRHLTLGIEERLQKNRMIKNTKLIIRKPAEKPSLSGWERKHCCHLPQDLKQYYCSTNGFKLTWSLEHAGDVLKIGDMNINEIKQLVPLDDVGELSIALGNPSKPISKPYSNILLGPSPNSKPIPTSSSHLINDPKASKKSLPGGLVDPNFEIYYSELRQTMEASGQVKSQDPGGLFLLPNDKAFILDSNRYGWVCLIYPEALNKVDAGSSGHSLRSLTKSSESPAPEPNIEIWFMDPSFQWHYLAPTFTHYYRMLLFHLGLPQWQYRFTQYGLSSWAEQMFWLVAPHLLTAPRISKFPSIYHAGGLWSTDVPVEASAPNPTPNVLTNQIFRRKKKDKSESK